MSASLPKLQQMVEELISTPSISSTQAEFDQSNNDVIDLLANWLDSLGFTVSLIPIANAAHKTNLIAKLGEGHGGLILSGHSDTVPFDEHLWRSNPFKLSELDDRWYGLGSCDMKSFFAIAMEAARPFLASELVHPLYVLATADEESSMSGARQLQSEELDGATFAVIGEPTNLAPITKHKGILMFNLRVEGTSGHSSNPELGDNAIEGMQSALAELQLCRQELKDANCDTNFIVPYPTMNFGCIHGGDNPNRICDHVELSFDLRNLPSMDMTGYTSQLEQRLQNRLEGQGFRSSLSLLHEPVPAFENSDSEIASSVEAITGHSSGSVDFGTEAPFLKALGIDTVVIGPGSIEQAHQPNEYLSVDQINPAVDLLRKLIIQHCT